MNLQIDENLWMVWVMGLLAIQNYYDDNRAMVDQTIAEVMRRMLHIFL